ncbi:hypothetical protein ACTXT7_009898 [Hymenolepis weldensis]
MGKGGRKREDAFTTTGINQVTCIDGTKEHGWKLMELGGTLAIICIELYISFPRVHIFPPIKQIFSVI